MSAFLIRILQFTVELRRQHRPTYQETDTKTPTLQWQMAHLIRLYRYNNDRTIVDYVQSAAATDVWVWNERSDHDAIIRDIVALQGSHGRHRRGRRVRVRAP